MVICILKQSEVVSGFKVKVQDSDSDLAARTLSVTLGSKEFSTPRRALHLTQSSECEAVRVTNPRIRGLNEIYRVIDHDALMHVGGDAERLQRLTSAITPPNTISNQVNVIFLSYESRGETRVPADREVELLFDILYAPFNDALVPPIIRNADANTYLDFLERFFSIAGSFNRKPVFGLIPYCSHLELDPILKFYISNGISLYAFDANGRHPLRLYANIAKVLRTLSKAASEQGEDFYLHGLNVGMGKALSSQAVVPARDILAFELGFDSFGPSHVRMKLSRDVVARMKKTSRLSIQLFNRKDYGYYRSELVKLNTSFGQEPGTTIKLQSFTNLVDKGRLRLLQRTFNAERQGLEANTISEQIREGQLKKYLQSKKHVKDALKQVFKLGMDMQQKEL